jgi:hypothetical protein
MHMQWTGKGWLFWVFLFGSLVTFWQLQERPEFAEALAEPRATLLGAGLAASLSVVAGWWYNHRSPAVELMSDGRPIKAAVFFIPIEYFGPAMFLVCLAGHLMGRWP